VVTKFNRSVANPLLRHLSGLGPFVEIEHIGRRSGLARRTPLLAFRAGRVVTVALTYGPEVDWLKNIEAAGGARLHVGRRVLDLGPPLRLTPEVGLARMPLLVRTLLVLFGVRDFIELPVLAWPERTHRPTSSDVLTRSVACRRPCQRPSWQPGHQ
jgi:deazaflavin-dependent oxidoreductase (nitroreductase family)